MSRITLIEPQKKNKDRFNVYINGEFIFGASSNLIVEERLSIGRDITENDLKEILGRSAINDLLEKVYVFLRFRNRSTKEVRDYLKKVSYRRKVLGKEELSPLIIDLVVEKIKEKKLIDDSKFAREWVLARRNKFKGDIAIYEELTQKGINREIIEEVLDSKIDASFLASKALEQKVRSWRDLSDRELFTKGVAFLMRRGFSYQVSKATVEKLLKKS